MIQILQGDVRKVLPTLPDESVHCVVTSPPYWGLRDYGCPGQLGLERTPEEYVRGMVDVFREVRRVLRSDGTLWLNMGDCYATGAGLVGECPGGGLKPKDLVGMPWRLAFALQAEGWYLRSDIIWHKPNPMPESVTDRPTKAHEYIFLLSKSERYFYNAEAIQEEAVCGDPRKPYAPGQVDKRGNGHDRGGGKIRKSVLRRGFSGKTNAMPGREAFRAIEDWRNKRTVWTVTTKPFSEAHFATFPSDLIKPCILAGTPEGGTVLDPFFGSGTTGLVARAQGCKCIGIELNADYIKIAEKRLRQGVMNFAEVTA